ncbi:hypothetical protein [Pararobbsia silviterrae]|uniref:Uncharacterized protein n=1 Tax=Pararobbsia silviterrae TaxID=1792498 RepID=A0A494X7E8_9BURK|nr:hypothetical protein [Pararobbsia silviterrae]RKP43929.1 hypothetical protein D7S86_28285 [Pararobbsia silviterrae]
MQDTVVQANGNDYEFKRYFECNKTEDLSEAGDGFHAHWHTVGTGYTTVTVGPYVLMYYIGGDCDSPTQDLSVPPQSLLPMFDTRFLRILDSAANPQRLDLLVDRTDGYPVVLKTNVVSRIERAEQHLGPADPDLALKEIIRRKQHGFQRVEIKIIPMDVWGVSNDAQRYFGQLKSVTIARVGEAPPRSGRAESAVRFPYFLQRKYQRGAHGEVVGLTSLNSTYDGGSFVIDAHSPDGVQTWYATTETRMARRNSSPAARVSYKGVEFEVTGLQEVYDPDTKNILLFTNYVMPYPWGGPEPVDIKQLSESPASQ